MIMKEFMFVLWILIGMINLLSRKIYRGDYLLIWATLIMYLIKDLRG